FRRCGRGRQHIIRQRARPLHQRRPLVRRIAGREHAPEYLVGIALAALLAQAALVVDPSVDDDARAPVVAEEEPEAAEELRPEPVPIFVAERLALAVFGPARSGR